jgi:hypothetical protein
MCVVHQFQDRNRKREKNGKRCETSTWYIDAKQYSTEIVLLLGTHTHDLRESWSNFRSCH